MTRTVSFLMLMALSFVAPSLEAQPASFTYTKIIDSSDPQFSEFWYAAMDGDAIAFLGITPSGYGVYTRIGGNTQVVADNTTPVPGGSGTFFDFFDLSLGGSTVAFWGMDEAYRAGIYANPGGVLTVVADENTPIPNGTGNFTGFSGPGYFPGISTDGSNVAFRGTGSDNQVGIYLWDGVSLSVIADGNTLAPGDGTNFWGFGAVAVDDGDVAFRGDSGDDFFLGIYFYESAGGTLSVVADGNDLIPGGTGNFRGVYYPVLDNNNVAFVGSGENPTDLGVYTAIEGSLNVVMDLTTPVPGGTGNFQGFLEGPSISGSQVALYALDEQSVWGIYSTVGGTLGKVIAPGDALDGDTVVGVKPTGREALSGNSVVFIADLSGGREGIFRADANICPTSTALAGRAERGDIQRNLYRLRDQILAPSPAGKFFTWLFYHHAEEIRSLMERYPDLRARTGSTLAALAPKIAVAAHGGVTHLSKRELREIEHLMDSYAARGSFRLRFSLWWLRYAIPYRAYLSQFGFRVGGQ